MWFLTRKLSAWRRSLFPKKSRLEQSRKAPLPMTSIATNLVGYFQEKREASWETAVRIIFGAFVGSLVILLILLYSGAPIV